MIGNMLNSELSRHQFILELQKNPKNIRNISIVAHVDHGKTTLSDSLISSNNIFSKQLAGELRYLNNREDEQERGITMKSSAISLIYRQKEDYLINLIDSPGHVEFSSEVSSALRLTDGALVLVDAVEGVSAQTFTVLKQCFEEKVKSVLVLNKLDKLKYELYQTPEETYTHLKMIIEQVNAVISSFINMEKEKMSKEPSVHQTANQNNHEDQYYKQAEEAYFSPEKDNIVFCSSIDCWSFRISDFAEIFAEKLEIKKEILAKAMWGEYYFNPKTKQIANEPLNDKSRPIFESFVIKNIWGLYDLVLNQETEKISKFCAAFKLKDLTESMKVNITREIKDKRKCVSYLMNQWLPLDRAIFDCAVQFLPSPIQGQQDRLSIISKKLAYLKDNKHANEYALMKKAIETCDNSPDAPIVAFICKMVCVTKPYFNERNLLSFQEKANDPPSRFMGFARLYSGKLSRGKTIYVIGPKSNSNDPQIHSGQIFPFTIQRLYFMMGPNQEGIQDVYAGNVFSIGGLDDHVFKTASISSFECCPSLTPVYQGAKGILKVSLTAQNLDDNAQLIEGLKKLNKSDPSVEVFTESNGDIILSTCGQVHKERCINDLEKVMSKVKIQVSDPIIQFKETVISKNMRNKKEAKNENDKINEDEEEEDIEALKRQAKEKFQKECEDVEIIDIQSEKDDDIRYGLLDEDKEKAKAKYKYKIDAPAKKKDLTNKGKTLAMLNKTNLRDIINKKNYICQLLPNGKLMLTVRCIGVKFEFAEFLEKSSKRMRKLFYDMSKHREPDEVLAFLAEFEEKVNEYFPEKKIRDMVLNNLTAFGPNRYGPNMLLLSYITKEECILEKLRKQAIEKKTGEENHIEKGVSSISTKLNSFKNWNLITQQYNVTPEEIQNSIAQGFDMAVQCGPLCMEQMMGVIYIVEDILIVEEELKKQNQDEEVKKPIPEESIKKENGEEEEEKTPKKEDLENSKKEELETPKKDELSASKKEVLEIPKKEEKKIKSGQNLENEEEESKEDTNSDCLTQSVRDPYGPLNGQIISTMKDCCFECFLGAQPRVVEGMYMCYVQTYQENYGKSFEVLNKKRAKILDEELQESSNIFLIKAHLPVCESLDFYHEMQNSTKGRINSQLLFDTWKILEIDPFYIPQTQEDLEEHGDKINVPNFAKDLIEKIRKRKGLFTDEKIVVAAEKQRNLNRKR